MFERPTPGRPARPLSSLIIWLLLVSLGAALAVSAQTPTAKPRTPTETVREFYKALREKRFREAFAISIY
ncbi:MAG TPA: hypothetical protein VF507_02230, partial [Pyrinomonadaceae bacterium]